MVPWFRGSVVPWLCLLVKRALSGLISLYDIRQPADQPATVLVQRDEDKQRYLRVSVCWLVSGMHVRIHVCVYIVWSLYDGVCRCVHANCFSSVCIPWLLDPVRCFWLGLVFLVAVVAAAADPHIAAIGAALAAAVAAAS